MPATVPTRLATAVLALGLSAGLLAACGDDSDDAAATTTAADSAAETTAAVSEPSSGSEPTETEIDPALEEYCAVAAELNGAAAPTAEQIAEWEALVPEEIAEPAETFVAAFEAADGDLSVVFDDPEVIAASDEIAAFDQAECGITPPGPPPGAGG